MPHHPVSNNDHFGFWETREAYLNNRTYNISPIRKQELHRITSNLVLSLKMEIMCSETNKNLVFENFNSSKQTGFASKKRIAMDPVKKPTILIEAELNNNTQIEPEEEYGRIEGN